MTTWQRARYDQILEQWKHEAREAKRVEQQASAQAKVLHAIACRYMPLH